MSRRGTGIIPPTASQTVAASDEVSVFTGSVFGFAGSGFAFAGASASAFTVTAAGFCACGCFAGSSSIPSAFSRHS